MKNIWILNHYAILGEGRHYKFALNLIKRGYNVKLFASSAIHNTNTNKINDSRKYIIEKEKGVPCIYIKSSDYTGNGKSRIKNMLDYSIGLMSVTKKFDDKKPDVIYASSVHPLTWLSGYCLAKRYKSKFIVETRDLWPETLIDMGRINKKSISAKLLYKFEKFIYKKADKLIFTFPGGKDYVKSIGIDSSKVRYINNGIDIEEFNFNKKNEIYIDADLDDASTFKVLYTGSMGQANELSYLLKAAKEISDRKIMDIKIILFGDGYHREELEKYVINNKLNNVIFKGKVDRHYIPNILSKSNLNVFTGKNICLYKYGLSLNKMFEYFGSGRPTLSNINCGYDIIEEYKCGITVKSGTIDDLVKGILKFYDMSSEQYNVYCKNALKAAENFDFKILTDKLESIILED